MLTSGKPTIEFMRALNKRVSGIQYFGLSSFDANMGIKSLGVDGSGMAVSQVVPYPFSAVASVIGEYQKLMNKAGHKDYSYASMEGFINAKVLTEALKRAGRDVNSERLVNALDGLGRFDLGGFTVNFSKSDHQGSHQVEISALNKDGKFIR